MKKRIAVFVSGGGTNLQALIDAQNTGRFKNAELVLVLSSNPEAYALERAHQNNIDTVVVEKKKFASAQEYDMAILNAVEPYNIDLIVFAGFLSILGETVLSKYRDRIINIHPSLIPSFCGKGFFGIHVHEAALEYGVKVTGATVHFVNEIPDGGAILLQKAVDVLPDDTPQTLQKRVMEQAEHILLPQAVALLTDAE